MGSNTTSSVFANEFQGGQYVEVLGTQGTNPLVHWRVTGPQKNLQKSYDKAVKGSVYASTGGGLKLQAPKDEKASLGLLQPYLVLQVSLNQGQPFTVEYVMSDTTNTRRRLILSSSFTEARVTPLHCQIPFAAVARDTWLNLTIPMAEIMSVFFKGATFKSLDTLTISGSCRLRRIATLRDPPYDAYRQYDQTSTPDVLPLPRGLEFPAGLDVFTQVLDARALVSLGVQLPAAPAPGTAGGGTRKQSNTRRGGAGLSDSNLSVSPATALTSTAAAAILDADSSDEEQVDVVASAAVVPGSRGSTGAAGLRVRTHRRGAASPSRPSGTPSASAGADQGPPGSPWAQRQQPPSSRLTAGFSRPSISPPTTAGQQQGPATAGWNANATEGFAAARRRGAPGLAGGSRNTSTDLDTDATALLALPAPAFAAAGTGRPLSDGSAAGMSGARPGRSGLTGQAGAASAPGTAVGPGQVSGPQAGRRAVSAQTPLRTVPGSPPAGPTLGRAGSSHHTTSGGAAAVQGASSLAARMQSPPRGRSTIQRVGSSGPAGQQKGGTGTAPGTAGMSALLAESGDALPMLLLLPQEGASRGTSPGSPNTRYGRRAGAAGAPGLLIPSTIDEGEVLANSRMHSNITSPTESMTISTAAAGALVAGAAATAAANAGNQVQRALSPARVPLGRAMSPGKAAGQSAAQTYRAGSPARPRSNQQGQGGSAPQQSAAGTPTLGRSSSNRSPSRVVAGRRASPPPNTLPGRRSPGAPSGPAAVGGGSGPGRSVSPSPLAHSGRLRGTPPAGPADTLARDLESVLQVRPSVDSSLDFSSMLKSPAGTGGLIGALGLPRSPPPGSPARASMMLASRGAGGQAQQVSAAAAGTTEGSTAAGPALIVGSAPDVGSPFLSSMVNIMQSVSASRDRYTSSSKPPQSPAAAAQASTVPSSTAAAVAQQGPASQPKGSSSTRPSAPQEGMSRPHGAATAASPTAAAAGAASSPFQAAAQGLGSNSSTPPLGTSPPLRGAHLTSAADSKPPSSPALAKTEAGSRAATREGTPTKQGGSAGPGTAPSPTPGAHPALRQGGVRGASPARGNTSPTKSTAAAAGVPAPGASKPPAPGTGAKGGPGAGDRGPVSGAGRGGGGRGLGAAGGTSGSARTGTSPLGPGAGRGGMGRGTPPSGLSAGSPVQGGGVPHLTRAFSHGSSGGGGGAAGHVTAGSRRTTYQGSTASSVADIEESLAVLNGWGGFGVDEDDVLGSRHFKQGIFSGALAGTPPGHSPAMASMMLVPPPNLAAIRTQPLGHGKASAASSLGASPTHAGLQPRRGAVAMDSPLAAAGAGAFAHHASEAAASPPVRRSALPPGLLSGSAAANGSQPSTPSKAAQGAAVSFQRPGQGQVEVPGGDALDGPIWSAALPSPSVKLQRPSLLDTDADVLRGDVTARVDRAGGSSVAATTGQQGGQVAAAGSGAGSAAPGPDQHAAPAMFTFANHHHHHHSNLYDSFGMVQAAGGWGGPNVPKALEDDWANVDKLMAVTPDLMLAGRAYTPPVIPPSRLVAGGAGGTTAMAAGAGQGTPAASGGGQAASGSGKPGPQGPQVFKLGSGNGRTGGPQQPAGEEMVDLVYDPVLNCYYDHKTNSGIWIGGMGFARLQHPCVQYQSLRVRRESDDGFLDEHCPASVVDLLIYRHTTEQWV